MKKTKLKIFFNALALAAIMAAGAAIVTIAGIEYLLKLSDVAFNKLCLTCVCATSAFAGIVGFTYELQENIKDNKEYNNIIEVNEKTDIQEITNDIEKRNVLEKTKNNIEPVVMIDDSEIKREISNEKPKELILKKETRKF